jgi:hypothetical protein
MQDEKRVEELTDFRRSVDDINDPAGAAAGNLNNTLGQPALGAEPFNPSWTLKEDPSVRKKDLEKLEKELDEAEEKKKPSPN